MVQIHTIAAAAVIGAATYTSATPVERAEALEARTFGIARHLFEKQERYWSRIAPWNHASIPSFTFGCSAPGIPVWTGRDKSQCKWFWNKWTPFCQNGNQPAPQPSTPQPGTDTCVDGYQQVYNNYQVVAESGVYQGKTVGAATMDNDNYLTYLLVSDLDKCLQACDDTKGCVFVNLYQDNADQPSDVSGLPPSVQPKFVKGNLTCALYKACSGTDKANNYGGQQDPTFITDSRAYCKGGKC
ncbi:hypothetical protein NDA11_000914 [Ustilago hordei]|uniref:Uncharacterized protein n=1 Tax=Ustilago hordei TaxID=120017 RepID=I2FU34_USTHO|nr:uncharacterized protein UHO2_07450 [Ustilago hordei]KAJ1043087.1 hypothetical protein NDA10_003740 [Ustilago hordei]KAJ1573135.1 hypothetical protein NDA12_006565 [Ustilago hordei]KAJ1577431.1 hypothetical protein NDA11_000914 [Ustilago hordei]KAJ1582189.1 hypothetical protein NDA15_004831 [Ustilago hordei]CCF50427.1 uncharacterized protein UHOR_05579 [Ustilago hordei]